MAIENKLFSLKNLRRWIITSVANPAEKRLSIQQAPLSQHKYRRNGFPWRSGFRY
jgi:hypothetical protein